MHGVLVMRDAQRRQVPFLVTATARTELHVVRVQVLPRGADRNRAAPAIPLHDLVIAADSARVLVIPRRDEGVQEPLDGLPLGQGLPLDAPNLGDRLPP